MLFQQIDKKSSFVFSEDIELLFAACNILEGETQKSLCSEVFGKDLIEDLRLKYHFLYEVVWAFQGDYFTGILEPLLDYTKKEFSLSEYRTYLLSLSPLQFLMRYFAIKSSHGLEQVINQEEKFDEYYTKFAHQCSSYLAAKSFIYGTNRFIEEFIHMAEDLRTQAFISKMEEINERIQSERKRCIDYFATSDAVNFSEMLMEAPYDKDKFYSNYIFSPSLFLSCKALRYFDQTQIIFYNIREADFTAEKLVFQLRALADTTRFHIITMIKQNQSVRALDICKELNLAASTVSHHMEQLSKAGLVKETPIRNSKYYSINQDVIKDLIRNLQIQMK